MRKCFSVLAASLLLAPFVLAEPAAPTPMPTKDEVSALVKQLGDDSSKVRDEASEKLRHLGKEALPALTEAKKSDDPEVAGRAQVITKQIDEDLHPKPKVDAGQIQLGGFGPGAINVGGGRMQLQVTSTMMIGNGRSVSISKTSNGTTKDVTVKEDGKTTKIHEDAAGISVAITQTKDGKEVTETTKAKDKDELKKDNPKIFEIYENLTKENVLIKAGGVQFRGRIANPNIAEIQKSMEESRKRAEEELKRAQKELEAQVEAEKRQAETPKK